jgi:DNA polymerase-3 subunit gamma/tau
VLVQEQVPFEEDALTLIARHADGGMRDALSMLDQCLSFGDGTITATRVREVLGLAGDELYAEVLGFVAERRPAAVFPLVDRLVDAGTDLAEFMNGAAEMLRALLILQLGSEPEGLTEAMRDSLRRYRDLLAPGDVLRMLKLLADNETAIRRSANARLGVETLLLRWAMLDRIVDLQQVLEGGPGSAAPRPSVPTSREERPARATSSGASAPTLPRQPDEPVAASPSTPTRPAPDSPVEFTVGALREAWPDIVAAVRERRAFLSEAVATAEPVEAAPPWLTIRLPEESALFVDPLQEQASFVEGIVRQFVGQPVRLRVVAGGGAESPPATAPKRMSDASIRADRLKTLRARDPALDLAADALDLEIVE